MTSPLQGRSRSTPKRIQGRRKTSRGEAPIASISRADRDQALGGALASAAAVLLDGADDAVAAEEPFEAAPPQADMAASAEASSGASNGKRNDAMREVRAWVKNEGRDRRERGMGTSWCRAETTR
jgi:hypothetical protein